MGFSRQESWSVSPFPCPGDLLDPGIEPGSPTLQTDSLLTEPPGKTSQSLETTIILSAFLSSFFKILHVRAKSPENTLMLGKIEGRRSRGWQTMRWLDGISDSVDMSWSKLREMEKDREAWRADCSWGRRESDTTYPLNNKRQVRAICFLQYFAVFAFLCLPYFTQHGVLMAHQSHHTQLHLLLFQDPIKFPCLCVYLYYRSLHPLFIYLSILLIYYLCIYLYYLISHLLCLLSSIYLPISVIISTIHLSICPPILLSLLPSFSLSHICFIHSSIRRHVGCSHILAVVNKTTMNIVLQLPFEVLISSLTPS